jgi:DNA-binding response OmpR family regulator
MSAAVLLAEPEPATRGYLERHLSDAGFAVLSRPEEGAPDLVLAGDLADVEAWSRRVPVIVLGREEEDVVDRVRAFQKGCDDYLGPPFAYEELVARIRAVLRRAAAGPAGVLEAGPVRIEHVTRTVTAYGERVALSQKEFELLVKLAGEPRRVFTKDELLREVWGFRSVGRTRTLDSHTSRLRRKLRVREDGEPLVVNVWGVGYKLLD